MEYSRVILIGGLIAVVGLNACSKNDTIKIGHAAPLTGPIAHLGKDNENGARLAIEDANARGIQIEGKKVVFELISADDQADPTAATTVAKKLVEAKVVGVVGHLTSAATIAAAKIYSDAGIPQISGSATNPQYTGQGLKTAFRVIANDIQQGKLVGMFITYAVQAKRVAIVDDRTPYGKGLADEVVKAVQAGGGIIVAHESTTDKATDFSTILTTIKAANPDVVFHGGTETTGAPMLKQMRDMGIKAQFLQGDGGCTAAFIKLAGSASEGFICSQPALPVDGMPSAVVTDFKARFEKKFGPIQLYAPYTYDAVTVMIAAMQKANSTDPAKYLPLLAKIRHHGTTGLIEFDEKGDIKAGFVTLYKAQCGKLEPLFVQQTADLMLALAAWKENIPMLAPCTAAK